MARVVGWLSLFASLYYVTVFMSDRFQTGALWGATALGMGALLALVPWPARAHGEAWFRGGRPTGWPGRVLALAAIALALLRFVLVDAHAHSMSDTLIGTVPVWSLIIGVLVAVDRLTGRRPTAG